MAKKAKKPVKPEPVEEAPAEDSAASSDESEDEVLEEEEQEIDDAFGSETSDSEAEDDNTATPMEDDEDKPKEHRPDEGNKTIFVGNLPINTKDKHLKTFFAEYGKVKSVRFRSQAGKMIFNKAQIAKDPFITAFVVFEEQESAEKALEKSGQVFRERRIRVTAAGEKKGVNRKTIFVGNLSFNTVDDDLYEVFSTCGELESVRTIRGAQGCKGIAYVTFKDKASLTLAMGLQGTRIRDRPIRVQKCKDADKVAKKEAKKEEVKNTKVVTKVVNGKHIKVTQSTNAGNALKRLQKKPGFNSDNKPPTGRPRPGVRGPPKDGAGDKGEGGHRKPGFKPKSPKQKGLPKDIQMAKKLNVNWKKSTYKPPPKKTFNGQAATGGGGEGGGAPATNRNNFRPNNFNKSNDSGPKKNFKGKPPGAGEAGPKKNFKPNFKANGGQQHKKSFGGKPAGAGGRAPPKKNFKPKFKPKAKA